MNENTEQPIAVTATTNCDHFYVSGKEANGLLEVFCTKCPHGIQIDPKLKIENGEILWK